MEQTSETQSSVNTEKKPSMLWYRGLKSAIKVQRCGCVEYGRQSIMCWFKQF